MNLLPCLLLSLVLPLCVAKDTVPTFLIDYDQVMTHLFAEPSPYARTSSSAFAEIIQDAITRCAVLIMFVEEKFCTEDVSMKDVRGSPFRNLHEHLLTYKVKYIPNVINPVKVMTHLLPPTQANVFVLNPGQIFHPSDSLRFFYVFFDDHSSGLLNETRIETLRRHDAVMEDVYKTTRKIANGAVIAFYTGKGNPIMMPEFFFEYEDYDNMDAQLPEQEAVDLGDEGLILISPGAMFRFIGLSVNKDQYLRSGNVMPTIVGQLRSDNYSITSMSVDPGVNKTTNKTKADKFDFHFMLYDKHWVMDHIQYTSLVEDPANKTTTEQKSKLYMSGVSASYDNSYYCDEPLIIHRPNGTPALIIPAYQLQPFVAQINSTNITKVTGKENKSEAGDKVFKPPKYCTPYFNIPILSGLMVSTLLLSALTLGFNTLYNCGTNDRFEDPYGKPLIIPDYD